MIAIRQGNLRKMRGKLCALPPKSKKILKFFDQNLTGNLTFFTISFLNIVGVLPPLRQYILLEDNTRLLQQFFRLGGGGRSDVPPPDATGT